MIKKFPSPFERCTPYALNAAKLILADRGMFIADFFLATTIPFVMQVLIWSYLYRENQIPAHESMNLSQTIFYFALAIGFGRLNNGYDIIAGLSQVVREGALEPHLLRPLPYPIQKLAEFIGGGILYTVPILIIALTFVLTTSKIPTLHFWFGWFILLISSQILCFLVSWCIAIMSFTFTRTDFALSLLTTSAAFFGGELLPPGFWPEALQPLMGYNPFRFMISAPAEALVKVDFVFLLESIFWCLSYIFGLTVVASLLWKNGIKKYKGAGG